MQLTAMSPSTTISEEGSVSSGQRAYDGSGSLNPLLPISAHTQPQARKPKKKRNQPGNPDPDAEVVALSPTTLMATNRYVCDLCGKGFQRDQNLQLHRRGHNLPWKLPQRDGKAPPPRKKVYVCPDVSCVHHVPSRALGDLTGIKKHFSRKHGEKKWSCERCSKSYAVMSDYKAHGKTCGTREYKCDCGAVFSRKDSFATHRAFCDALAEESARIAAAAAAGATSTAAADITTDNYTPFMEEPQALQNHQFSPQYLPSWDRFQNPNPNPITPAPQVKLKGQPLLQNLISASCPAANTYSHLAATALLQRAAAAGHLANASASSTCVSAFCGRSGPGLDAGGGLPAWQRGDCSLLTRDFLGVAGEEEEVLLSLTSGFGSSGGMECMGPPAAASGDCLGGAATGTTPEAAAGFGFPTAATAASPSWWRLLE